MSDWETSDAQDNIDRTGALGCVGGGFLSPRRTCSAQVEPDRWNSIDRTLDQRVKLEDCARGLKAVLQEARQGEDSQRARPAGRVKQGSRDLRSAD